MLEVRNLSARYGDSRVLDDVSFTVADGDFFGILGPNGAGKTTILRALAGLTPPEITGSLRWNDVDLSAEPAHRRPALGVAHVPEGRRVFSSLTVDENLLMGAYRRGRAWQARNLDRVLEIFPELADRRDQQGGSLSGGQQQMVSIGRALMSEPRLLLLDEPSLGLAPVVVARVFDLLTTLHRADRDLTIVLVEQNALEAIPLLTRGCVIERGGIVVSGTRAELEASPTVAQAYFGAPS